MSTEKITANWFKTRYHMTADGWFLPVPKHSMEDYDPFNLFSKDRKDLADLYLHFANIDVEKMKEVEDFYSQYGPLGLLAREITGIYSTGDDDEPLVVGLVDLEEGIPFSDILAPMYKFDAQQFIDDFRKEGKVPSKLDIQKKAGEDSRLFKWEHQKFIGLLNLYISIKAGDIQLILDRLTELDAIVNNMPKPIVNMPKLSLDNSSDGADDNQESQSHWEIDLTDGENIKVRAMEIFMGYMNEEIADGPSLILVLDPVSLSISKEIHWHCDSLLNAMYIMLMNNITDDMRIRQCVGCGNYYRGGRPEMIYCGISCQNRAKVRRYQEQIRKVQEMHQVDKIGIEEIANQTGKKVELIKKWIELGKS